MRKISHWWIIFLLLTKVNHLNGATSTTDSGAISSVTSTVFNETSSQPTKTTTSFAQNATSISSTSTTSTASSDNQTYTSSPTHPTSTTSRPTTVTKTTTTLTTNPMSSSTNAEDNESPTADTGTGTATFPPSTTPVSTIETSTNALTSSVTGSESSSIASTAPSPSTTSSNEMTTPFSTSSSVETVSTAIITTTPLSQTTPISDNTPSSSQTTPISDTTTSSSQTTSISDNTTSSIESTTGAVATSTTDSDTTITTSAQSSSEYATTSQPHATSSVSFQTSTKQPTTTSSIIPPSTTTTTTTTKITSATKSTGTLEQSTTGKTIKTPSMKDQQLYYAASGAAVVVLAVVVILVLVLIKMRRRHKWCFSTDVELYNSFEDSMELDYIHLRPGPVKLQDFSAYLDKLHRNDNLLFAHAFTLLHEDSPSGVSSAAMLEKNEDKNRYVNILAFDHSRVKLRQINDDQTTDYINANFLPGYTYRREYIATQGPLPNTLDDFWRMIWEQNVEIIVMVTKLVENGNPKCDKYWPDIGNVSVHGDFTVTTKTEVNNSKFTLRTLEMTKAGEKPRSIRQYAFLLWPDMGVPETPSALLEFVQAVRSGAPRKEAGPIVVHCSAGVGRTGTFIAVDHLLQMIRKNDEIDVFGQVMEMRKYRASMVQTEAQFVFIYDCIKDFMMTDDEHGEATEDEDEEIKEDEKVEADRMLKPALGQDNPAFEDTAD